MRNAWKLPLVACSGLTTLVLLASSHWNGTLLAHPPDQDKRAPMTTELTTHLREQSRKAPIVVAHRGDSGIHPENTMVAFEAALLVGAPVIELDFHQTKDGVLVCLHDATLDRTTDARNVFGGTKLKVADKTLEELRGLDAGSWKDKRFAEASIPTLEEALQRIQPEAITMIEHKAGRAADLVALLRRRGDVGRVIVQSFDWDWLEEVHALEPKLTIAALSDQRVTKARLDDVPRTGASILHYDHQKLTAQDVRQIQQLSYLVCVYTVDPDIALVGCAALGIDMVTTNRPARLRELVSEGLALRGGPGKRD